MPKKVTVSVIQKPKRNIPKQNDEDSEAANANENPPKSITDENPPKDKADNPPKSTTDENPQKESSSSTSLPTEPSAEKPRETITKETK